MLLDYEVPSLHGSLPVRIFKKVSNAHTEGCYYHWHEMLEIYYVLEGGIYLLYNGSGKWIYPNKLAVVNWCEPHKSLQFLDHTKHYIIQIDISSPLFYAVHQEKSYPSLLCVTPKLENLLDSLIQEYDELESPNLPTICGYTLLVLGELLKAHDPEAKFSNKENLIYIKAILSHIHSSFTGTILLDDISQDLGISKSHMCRIFKKHTGSTIVQYINNLRCHYALSLIESGYNVSRAAEAAGFMDYNYFSRTFKKILGLSPSGVEKTK